MTMKVLAGCDEAWQGLQRWPPASPLSLPLSACHVLAIMSAPMAPAPGILFLITSS